MPSHPSRVVEPCPPELTRETAYEYVCSSALRPGPIGRVGLEFEAHLVDLHQPERSVGWDRLTAVVAGLPPMPGGSAVTVEPGGQLELSGPPYEGVAAAVAALRRDRATLRAALADAGMGTAAVGADPARPARRVNAAGRYAAMETYFTARGNAAAGAAMMCSTASLQVNLDAGPAAGWRARVRLAHRLGPVLVALSACSPLLAGRESGWRSTRQRIWGELDRARCGPMLGRAEPAAEWAAYAMRAPVMAVRDADAYEPLRSPVSFADWVDGRPLAGRAPTVDDLDFHLTTLFPPVRPRGFLEIRYLDATPARWWPALAALTTTLLDDPAVADAAAEICAPLADAWTTAARAGLADPQLRRAAVACLAAALPAVPAELRAEVADYAQLVEAGRCPGDLLLDRARRDGPLAVLEGEARA